MAGKTWALPPPHGRTLWLAGSFLVLGLMWPEIVSCVCRALPTTTTNPAESLDRDGRQQQGFSGEDGGDNTPWEVSRMSSIDSRCVVAHGGLSHAGDGRVTFCLAVCWIRCDYVQGRRVTESQNSRNRPACHMSELAWWSPRHCRVAPL